VGGYAPEKVALRRAINLAYNDEENAELLRNGTAIEAKSLAAPGVLGYDPNFNTGKSYDPAKAKALLDMFGYVDRDGDGYREMPDGSPLTFVYATDPSRLSTLCTQPCTSARDAVVIRMKVDVPKWPDHRKKSKAAKLMSWERAWG